LQGADGKKAHAWLTLGEVVAVHIDKAMIKDGVYQTGLARPIVRAGRKGDFFEIRPEACSRWPGRIDPRLVGSAVHDGARREMKQKPVFSVICSVQYRCIFN
jgi:hypothetical protein